MLTHDQLRRHGVYVYIPDAPLDLPKHHAGLCLMSGLKRLRIPVACNLRVPIAGVAERPIGRPGGELNVFVITERNHSRELLDAIGGYASPHKVVISMADNVAGIFPPADVPALMTHENRFRRIEGWRIPWAFGLSDQNIEATREIGGFAAREPVILRNFRPSANQHVRNALDLSLIEHLEQSFRIDRAIAGDHFERLKRYVGCVAYGGALDENFLLNGYFANQPAARAYYERVTFERPVCVVRWDSWRWWESLAAGCLTFQLSFEKYGFQLPVMPVAWQHYVPVDFAEPRRTVEELLERRSEWADIAAAGRAWALEHYSPEPTARRLLDYAVRGFKV